MLINLNLFKTILRVLALLEICNFARTVRKDFARTSPLNIITRIFNEEFARKYPHKCYGEDLVWNCPRLVLVSDLVRK